MTATNDDGGAWYVRSIARAAEKTGIACEIRDLGPKADAALIAAELDALAQNADVHGMILQTPLPHRVSAGQVAGHIALRQDMDGANPASLARLVAAGGVSEHGREPDGHHFRETPRSFLWVVRAAAG